jgi:hypothetical protein
LLIAEHWPSFVFDFLPRGWCSRWRGSSGDSGSFPSLRKFAGLLSLLFARRPGFFTSLRVAPLRSLASRSRLRRLRLRFSCPKLAFVFLGGNLSQDRRTQDPRCVSAFRQLERYSQAPTSQCTSKTKRGAVDVVFFVSCDDCLLATKPKR